MSSILDALEKANRERAAKQGESGLMGDGRQSAREKQLRREAERQRLFARVVMIAAVVIVFCAVGAVGWMMMRGTDRTPSVMAADTKQAAPMLEPPVEQIVPEATPITTPSPSPSPSPTPEPTPSPTPEPTPTPQPTPVQEAIRTPRPWDESKPYIGLFRDGQVIRPEELDLEITGVMELRNGFVAIINDKQIRAGQLYGTLHIIDIQFGLVTIDVGDGTLVKVRF